MIKILEINAYQCYQIFLMKIASIAIFKISNCNFVKYIFQENFHYQIKH